MNKTENRKDEFDLALENMKLEPEADLDRLIEKRVKQMMTRISLKVFCVVLLACGLDLMGLLKVVAPCKFVVNVLFIQMEDITIHLLYWTV